MYTPDSKTFEYKCGLVPGQSLRLKRSLELTDSSGKVIGVMEAGSIWGVLAPGFNVTADRWNDDVLWLREPDGSSHTWPDDSSVFEFFESVGE